jgi:glyoxylase-like metal-dependent hydrolase (beta-lactamase superfamily II)
MRISDRVFLVGGGSAGFGLSHDSDCHVYLIDGGSEAALIDAGAGLGRDDILANIRGHGLATGKISHLFLTHLHADHSGGAAGLKEKLPGLKGAVAEDMAFALRRGDEEAIGLIQGRQGGYYPDDYRYRPCPVDLELRDGQEIAVGRVVLRVITTPGHSAGHVCFVMDDGGKRHLFTGDNLFFGGRILLQPVPDCHLQDHLASLRKLAGLGVDVFLPGHGAFSLRQGQRHIDEALAWLDRCLVPPSYI